jgi:hypothetical protein
VGTGQTYVASAFDSLHEAAESLVSGEVLAVDSEFVISEPIEVPSGVSVLGFDGKITADSGTNADLIRLRDVSDVLISGLKLDGNGAQNDGTRLIGGVDLKRLENVRITNCTLHSSASNAIELVDRQGGELKDIYIGGNIITKSQNHGIIVGIKGGGGELRDLVIENNTIRDSFHAQSIGVFAQDSSEAHSSAVIGNLVDNTGGSHKYGTNIAFEERANNNVAYANRIVGDPAANRGGIAATKDADRNIIGNNRVSQCDRSLQVQNLDWYEPQGPPRHNLVVRNHVKTGLIGFYYSRLDGNLHVSDNRFEDVDKSVADGGDNTGANYTFYNNGPSVPPSACGLPQTVGSSVEYVDNEGSVIGVANWERGSVQTDDPVSVSVTVQF